MQGREKETSDSPLRRFYLMKPETSPLLAAESQQVAQNGSDGERKRARSHNDEYPMKEITLVDGNKDRLEYQRVLQDSKIPAELPIRSNFKRRVQEVPENASEGITETVNQLPQQDKYEATIYHVNMSSSTAASANDISSKSSSYASACPNPPTDISTFLAGIPCEFPGHFKGARHLSLGRQHKDICRETKTFEKPPWTYENLEKIVEDVVKWKRGKTRKDQVSAEDFICLIHQVSF